MFQAGAGAPNATDRERGRRPGCARDYKEYLKLRQHFDVLNTIAERCARAQAGPDESGYDAALSQVSPQGHLFDAPQTIARCDSEFCPPIVHDYAKFGTWQERGSQSADERATAIWQDIVDAPSPVAVDADRLGDLQAFIQRRGNEGGAAPVSG